MHATFAYNKSGFDKSELAHPLEGEEPTTIKKLSTKQYGSQTEAIFDFESRLTKVQNDKREHYAILLHTSETIEATPNVILVTSVTHGSFDAITCENPFYRNSVKPKRNTMFNETVFKLNGSMHSQFFGMLDKSAYDQKLMERYQLNDIQVDNLYEFQQQSFEYKSVMSRIEVVRLVRNILSFVKLPWIDIYFMPDGDAAYFAVEMGEGQVFKPDEEPEGDPEQHTLTLEEAPETNPFLKPIDMEALESITINKLSLHLPETWALNRDTVIHELSHYICFMVGLNVPFYKNKDNLDRDLFTLVFSSHGKLFCTIFAQLLMRFCYIDKKQLYNTLDKHGVSYYEVDRFDESLLYNAIKKEFDENPQQELE